MSKVNGVYKRDVSPWLREIEGVAHSVERCSVKRLVNMVSTSDGVRSEERDDLEGSEASGILETLENLGDAVLRLRDQANDSRDSRVRTAGQELYLRGTLKTIR